MSDSFEGLRPDAAALDEAKAKAFPIHAFALLESGDAFDVVQGQPPSDGRSRAASYFDQRVKLKPHGASEAVQKQVRDEFISQILGNTQLIARLCAAKAIDVDLIPAHRTMDAYGYPPGASARAVGLFWDHPKWPTARIAFLQRALANERALVVHEFAHAIFRLAFTTYEQDLVYRLMLPTYRYRSHVDEVFAIYSEREFLSSFTEREGHSPGVYGMARQRWNERHVFTRFVRKLYHPHKPLAGTTAPIPKGLLG